VRPSPAEADVTVVVRTRNRVRLLQECIASVEAQRGAAWELVVVDDASSDGTGEWLDTVRGPRLTAVRLPEWSNVAGAGNRGLELARAGHVMFLDDDDLLEPTALRTLSTALADHRHAIAAVGARRSWYTEAGYRRRDAHPRTTRVRTILDDLLSDWSAVSGQVLYRTELVRRVGGFDPDTVPCEDRDLWLRLAPLGPVVLCPPVTVTYRVHGQVRRPDIRAIRERVAQCAIASLPAGDQPPKQRLRRTVRQLDRAEDEVVSGSVARGVALVLHAVLENPRTFTSPLVGPWTARRFGGRIAWRAKRTARLRLTRP
jgi:hypothetical protein